MAQTSRCFCPCDDALQAEVDDLAKLGLLLTRRLYMERGGRVCLEFRDASVSLDGSDWLLATAPKNIGREEKWFGTPHPEARRTKAPWIIQSTARQHAPLCGP